MEISAFLGYLDFLRNIGTPPRVQIIYLKPQVKTVKKDCRFHVLVLKKRY